MGKSTSKSGFFRDPTDHFPNVTNTKVLQGKQLSYNNIIDTDAALEIVKDYEKPAAAIIKHTNPCGRLRLAISALLLSWLMRWIQHLLLVAWLHSTEPVLRKLPNWLKIKIVYWNHYCSRFWKKVPWIFCPSAKICVFGNRAFAKKPEPKISKRFLVGFWCKQQINMWLRKMICRLKPRPSPGWWKEAMLFARVLVKHVKSNAVVFAKNHDKGGCVATGIGAGQMSRVDSVVIARRKGGDRVPGSVMGFRCLFPFPRFCWGRLMRQELRLLFSLRLYSWWWSSGKSRWAWFGHGLYRNSQFPPLNLSNWVERVSCFAVGWSQINIHDQHFNSRLCHCNAREPHGSPDFEGAKDEGLKRLWCVQTLGVYMKVMGCRPNHWNP